MKDLLRCSKCEELLPLNRFYPSYRTKSYGTCKTCLNSMKRKYVEEERSQCCGSKFIPNEPNKYKDEYQKECVFMVLPILGYQFCEETGIWWKEGWKDKDGKFMTIKGGESKFRNNKLSPDLKLYIIELYLSGMRMSTIARKVKLSYQTVRTYIRFYEKSTNRGTGNTE